MKQLNNSVNCIGKQNKLQWNRWNDVDDDDDDDEEDGNNKWD